MSEVLVKCQFVDQASDGAVAVLLPGAKVKIHVANEHVFPVDLVGAFADQRLRLETAHAANVISDTYRKDRERLQQEVENLKQEWEERAKAEVTFGTENDPLCYKAIRAAVDLTDGQEYLLSLLLELPPDEWCPLGEGWCNTWSADLNSNGLADRQERDRTTATRLTPLGRLVATALKG